MSELAHLSPERWSRFDLGQQIVQIGLEMHRARRFLTPEEMPTARLCYERALRLLDLTAQVNTRRSLRKELLLWREVVAGLYLADESDLRTHRLATRVLLELDPVAAEQIQYLDL